VGAQTNNVAFHRVIDGFMAQTGDVQHGNMEKNEDPGTRTIPEHPDVPAGFQDPACPRCIALRVGQSHLATSSSSAQRQ
jgi:cyclophilin family peptidyl-prolyl cis-trans isomerase